MADEFDDSEEEVEEETEDQIEIPIINISDSVGYDGASRRFFGRPIPEERRCTALKKNCVCGYHYKKEDRLDENGKKKDPPYYCPTCGRLRARCANPKEHGTGVCRFHGAGGVAAKRKKNFHAYTPTRLHLDDEDVDALEKMLKEDDDDLKEEFHILRILFGKALKQFNDTYAIQIENGFGDVIREADRLASVLGKLSKISNDRKKANQFISPGEQLQKVEFEDPRVKYLIKEMMRENEINAITKILMVVLKSLDPSGKTGLAQKLPESLFPYISEDYMKKREASEDESQENEGVKKDVDGNNK